MKIADTNNTSTFIAPYPMRDTPFYICGLLCLAIVGILMFISNNIIIILISVLLGMAGFLLLVLPFDLSPMNQLALQDFTQLSSGESLAHWTFPINDWIIYVEKWKNVIHGYGDYFFNTGIVAGLIITIFIGVSLNTPWYWSVSIIISILCCFLVLSYLIKYLIRRWGCNRAQLMLNHGGHIYIGKTCAYFSGKHLHWDKEGYTHLIGAKIFRLNPWELELTTSGYKGKRKTIRIPVPVGSEKQAEQISQQLTNSNGCFL
jgi:hypothetical protein